MKGDDKIQKDKKMHKMAISNTNKPRMMDIDETKSKI